MSDKLFKMKCSNCSDGTITPLNRKANPRPETIWQCDQCRAFAQPFLAKGQTPTTIWDIPCVYCHQDGFIAGDDSENEELRGNIDKFFEENEPFNLLVCVHCGIYMEYNIREKCEILYPLSQKP